MQALTSIEILEKISDSAVAKARGSIKHFILAILAGAYIAFGAQASVMASFNLVSDPALWYRQIGICYGFSCGTYDGNVVWRRVVYRQ